MKSAALFIFALTSAVAFADVLPPYKAWPDSCESHKKDGDACTQDGGFAGKCRLLATRERKALELPSRRRCLVKDDIGEPCLVCVSEAYRSSERPKKAPDAGKPR
jgi:hypothetical protein